MRTTVGECKDLKFMRGWVRNEIEGMRCKGRGWLIIYRSGRD